MCYLLFVSLPCQTQLFTVVVCKHEKKHIKRLWIRHILLLAPVRNTLRWFNALDRVYIWFSNISQNFFAWFTHEYVSAERSSIKQLTWACPIIKGNWNDKKWHGFHKCAFSKNRRIHYTRDKIHYTVLSVYTPAVS